MLRVFIEHWWFLAVRGALALAFALLGFSVRVMVANHYLAAVVLAGVETFFALFAIASGVVTVIASLFGVGEDRWWLLLADGALAVAAGVFVLTYAQLDFLVLVRAIALWGAAAGIVQLVTAAHLRRHVADEWFLAAAGLASLLLAGLLFTGGFHTDAALLMLLSWYALFSALVMTAVALRMRQSLHHARAEGDAVVDGREQVARTHLGGKTQ